ncbi:hypothetical protein NL108_000506 [Boleophthalmus pectinirostris]|uniref:uncharacterized protein LOC110159305 isoform X1 n=1 Tax=Boleophthalmus pectinirostris TaxID=150288 RepID=UPI00242B2007|nr:uncharacterized protein LOC110159305 isoform X1 [Boleophthalmus pectinirostris]KAJ0058782.1 hypothetical protein NL108_000506 [Boleophthalmus pectinirostris]
MLLKRQSECATVYLVVAVFLALHPTQMEAATLRRTEKRDGRKEPTASSIREGVILFGKAPKNASLDDDTSYQADFTGFHKGKVFDVSSKEAQWKRMSPSLLCGSDHMKFRAVGSPVKYLALNQHPPMPLSHMPTTCGYNMHSHPFGLVMDVPYGGCYVVHEHGHYHLQLLWNGIPVTLICPKLLDVSATASPVTDYPFTLPWHQPTAVAPQDPTYPQVPPGFHHSPYFQYLFQLLPKTGQNSAHWQFQNQNHWHHLHHKTSQSTSSPQDAANVYNLYQQLLQQNQATTTTASPQDQASMQAKLSYLYQMLQQNQGYTTPFPQDQSSMLAYFYYLNQLLQQNQTSTASPQNSSFWECLSSLFVSPTPKA